MFLRTQSGRPRRGPSDFTTWSTARPAQDKTKRVASYREFAAALTEIGLIDAAELERFAADSAEGVLGLSRALVKADKLTPYQAAAIYQNKSRGLLVGDYLILDKVGQGGMGLVFKARHRKLGRYGASRSFLRHSLGTPAPSSVSAGSSRRPAGSLPMRDSPWNRPSWRGPAAWPRARGSCFSRWGRPSFSSWLSWCRFHFGQILS